MGQLTLNQIKKDPDYGSMLHGHTFVIFSIGCIRIIIDITLFSYHFFAFTLESRAVVIFANRSYFNRGYSRVSLGLWVNRLL